MSNYQFHASKEWFAELFAVYYAENLPDTHAHYAMVQQAVS